MLLRKAVIAFQWVMFAVFLISFMLQGEQEAWIAVFTSICAVQLALYSVDYFVTDRPTTTKSWHQIQELIEWSVNICAYPRANSYDVSFTDTMTEKKLVFSYDQLRTLDRILYKNRSDFLRSFYFTDKHGLMVGYDRLEEPKEK
jgi:hypothetical protein